jgi:hypothetical protein
MTLNANAFAGQDIDALCKNIRGRSALNMFFAKLDRCNDESRREIMILLSVATQAVLSAINQEAVESDNPRAIRRLR